MNCVHDETPDNAKLCLTAIVSKGLSSAEQHYCNIKDEALGILQGLEKFHHYCFVKEGCNITDSKPLVAILSKDVATLSQKLQLIMLRINQ